MPTYRVTIDRPLEPIPDRDAEAITVRVHCDGNNLGLYQTWITGPEWMAYDHLHAPYGPRQFARLLADRLALAVQELAREGKIRSTWQEQVDVLYVDVNAAISSVKAMVHSVPDYAVGDELLAFDV